MLLTPTSLHAHRHGPVLVPLNVVGLEPEILALREHWAIKEEFHLTAISASWLAERLGRDVAAVSVTAAEAASENTVTAVTLRRELRVVRTDAERTIVAMAHAEGLDPFYAELALRLDARRCLCRPRTSRFTPGPEEKRSGCTRTQTWID
ncbi:MAG: hypothetical protein M3P40_06530 [Actinomycetota bacterium]|nr:hypothetical protein [Actinomycetota bacterium]